MSTPNFYFFFQAEGKESQWQMALASDRAAVQAKGPAFITVLDLSSVPDDNDWTKVRYRGPFYADFDADGDLDLVCNQFREFLGKLHAELDFDISQARMFATGGKGFHIEIPAECFMPKVPPTGTAYLAYVYREMAQALIVDTLDLRVYTGKRGRQWRTPNVRRDSGTYKVELSVEQALTIDAELYEQLVKEPQPAVFQTPPMVNGRFAMLFDRSKSKVVDLMRGKKKRQDKANAVLDPWRKAGKVPPTVERVMSGEDLREGTGFQAIAMQLSIFAATTSMPLAEFLERCRGLIQHHVSDSRRYNTEAKRREELTRMWEYMSENNLYDFEVGPMVRLLPEGTPATDLGQIETEDSGDVDTRVPPAQAEGDVEDGDTVEPTAVVTHLDSHKRLRRGLFMNSEGMFRKTGEESEPLCRATLRRVEAFYNLDKHEFQGYEFDMYVGGRKKGRYMLAADAFTSCAALRKFFANHQVSFQGTDADASSLLDIMSEKAQRGAKVYAYPREGFFVVNNPEVSGRPSPVLVYLTKDTYISTLEKGHPDYFELKYRAGAVTSSYDIDIHFAPHLEESMESAIDDLMVFNKPLIVADMLGWFVAAHYRSLYLHLFQQFPLLQAFGQAGSGKTQTVLMLAHLHWFMPERRSVKSALSATNYAIDAHASSSTSAPFLMDEYKPRELRMHRGKLEKIKDVFKASYVGSDIGERGTINKGAENTMAIIKSKCTAPICFMAESLEMETAIIERSVQVAFTKASHTVEREKAFNRLQSDPVPISALGRAIVEAGFGIDLARMREEFNAIREGIMARQPEDTADEARMAPRMIFNRAIVIHGLTVLKRVLATKFGDTFDERIEALINARDDSDTAPLMAIHSMAEISKVLNRLSLLSREKDQPHEMQLGKDYMEGEGWIEIRIERSYDQYRRYCAQVRETPLFDTLESYLHALGNYSPTLDVICADSAIRPEGSAERVFRFSLSGLRKERVGPFRN
jgi:hypothetical protein